MSRAHIKCHVPRALHNLCPLSANHFAVKIKSSRDFSSSPRTGKWHQQMHWTLLHPNCSQIKMPHMTTDSKFPTIRPPLLYCFIHQAQHCESYACSPHGKIKGGMLFRACLVHEWFNILESDSMSSTEHILSISWQIHYVIRLLADHLLFLANQKEHNTVGSRM